MDTEKRDQVAAQCRAIVHLATTIAQVHTDYAVMFAGGYMANATDRVGQRTASLMEMLGDVLNGMDAATEEDDWMIPIFREAQRIWPTRVTQ